MQECSTEGFAVGCRLLCFVGPKGPWAWRRFSGAQQGLHMAGHGAAVGCPPDKGGALQAILKLLLTGFLLSSLCCPESPSSGPQLQSISLHLELSLHPVHSSCCPKPPQLHPIHIHQLLPAALTAGASAVPLCRSCFLTTAASAGRQKQLL